MRLVEDECVVAKEPAVALDLGEQDAVGHQFHQGAVARLVGEADGETHGVPERCAQFVGDALGHRARGEAARLGVADGAADAAAEFEADLGQLSGFARAGFAGDDDHLVVVDGFGDLVAPLADRQIGIRDRGHGGGAGGYQSLRGGDLLGDLAQLRGVGAADVLQSPAEAGGVADRQAVEARSQVGDGRLGHCQGLSGDQ